MDISGSSYSRSSYPQPQTTYDPDMGIVRPRHHLLVVTILCSLKYFTNRILLPTYLDKAFHSHTVSSRIPFKAKAKVSGLGTTAHAGRPVVRVDTGPYKTRPVQTNTAKNGPEFTFRSDG